MTYDVIVIGGGPSGLSAALLLGRALRRVLVVDAGNPRNLAAAAMHGYLGHDGVRPTELLKLGRLEIDNYGIEFDADEVTSATAVDPEDVRWPTSFEIKTRRGRVERCRKLLFATGLSDTLPDISGLSDLYGKSVHHCPYCDGYEHKGQHLLAIGSSGREAAGLGISLRGWSDRVTVLTQGDAISSEDLQQLERNGIAVCKTPIVSLEGADGQLKGVTFADGRTLAADALFFNTVPSAQCLLPKSLGCSFEEENRAATTPKQCTNVPGVFLAGDADGDVQFVIVAAAEGATAGVAINRELQDEDRDS